MHLDRGRLPHGEQGFANVEGEVAGFSSSCRFKPIIRACRVEQRLQEVSPVCIISLLLLDMPLLLCDCGAAEGKSGAQNVSSASHAEQDS